MLKSIRRLTVILGHAVKAQHCSSMSLSDQDRPSLHVSPMVCMVDEPIHIRMSGLDSSQLVTFVLDLIENDTKFESRCLYKADNNGIVDNCRTHSLEGSFTGVEQMGLFWSLKSVGGGDLVRLVKKDVTQPMVFSIKVLPGNQVQPASTDLLPLAETKVQRLFMRPGVRRIRLTGQIKGTVFVPQGEGPFPGLVDMFGGLVSQIETRAALLASHGYATLSLSYLYGEGLPTMLMGADINYIQKSFEWLSEQEYVDEARLGVIGLCFGGHLGLRLATLSSQVKVVVNINGVPIISSFENLNSSFEGSTDWSDKVYTTEEGVVINQVFDCFSPILIPAWQHGARLLVIVGEDDKQVHPKWHTYLENHIPDQYRHNLQVFRYEGAGHLIEPPFMPHIRTVAPGRKRMLTVDFIPEKFKDEKMMAGGYPKPHADAQEHSWKTILEFLEANLKSLR
ncbi:bile acid-CoA:amino acid N-acyltransferase-like isoform X2 [Dreissena polymorpha]|uniref:Uncharacterized protein n=1 Tax=Dreissena polymorpha TaxID=45954 RepID=A0A9D4CKT2_DREPO|nr:bile acid-CoA:amino acid N-acyltransferase-like isoform X2 [Dreissena polymorpha]KAH3726110.1 hypothetical protein DPMN_051966 [Dreissena polymorpha]